MAYNPDQPREPAGSPEGGEFASDSAGAAASKETTRSDRSLRAKAAEVKTGKYEQRIADQTEDRLANVLGIPRTPDNSAFDLQNLYVGVEIKTMISNTSDQISMKADQIARKVAEANRAGIKMYTVVADRRTGSARYYIKEGVGNFRLGSMQKTTLPALKNLTRAHG